jgi:hypothetical protein
VLKRQRSDNDERGIGGTSDAEVVRAPSDAIRAAALIDRQEALTEQYRCVGKASYRRRLEIEAELSAIRRDLERLGFAAGLPLARGRR